MTFKHVKFEDSPIMRSLERVAQEKGLVKPSTLTKTAAKTVDLTPTNSLLDNIIKLCDGLRDRGFQKQADELENNLVNYKKAQTMYETSPEKGEDLVQAAHPKGSHKLEGIDADEAVFEDILDQHVKSLEMINKKPTGKLSSAGAIEAVKKVLANDQKKNFKVVAQATDPEQLEKVITNNVAKILSIMDGVSQLVKNEITFYSDFTRKQEDIKKSAQNTTLDNLQDISSQIDAVSTRIDPNSWFHYTAGLGLSGITQDTWATVQPMLNGAKQLASQAIQARKQILAQRASAFRNSINTPAVDAGPAAPPDQVTQKYQDTIHTIGLLKSRIQAKDLPNAAALIDWLDNQAMKFATTNLQAYSKSEFKTDPQVMSSYLNKVDNVLKPRLDAFQQKWSL